jgi:hypothetical protein
VISEDKLRKLLEAKIDCEPQLWGISGPAKTAVKFLTPVILRLIRDELADAKRDWEKRSVQL